VTPATAHSTGLAWAVFLLASAATATAAIVVAVRRAPRSAPPGPEPLAVTVLAPPAEPIPAEVQMFRSRSGRMAIKPESRRIRSAHPRTLKTWRYLRAYPGAPPRIPHGLSAEEYRTDACKTCHEEGGYSARFAAYVPLTPHPEMGMCLQCHVGDEVHAGGSQPSSDPNSRCPQCHGSGGFPRPFDNSPLDWRTSGWPQLARREPDGAPPVIPHQLQFRGNCLACHAGPAAVAEIRTTHPERADCRQCHVAPDLQAAEFTRPAPKALARPGGLP
jgi:cytochrome c-type protein NapB